MSEAAAIGQRFVGAARTLDAGTVSSVLDDLFSRGSFERVVTDLLFPALRDLGDAWAAGEVSVAGEHLASNAVLRRLGLALDAAGRTNGGAGSIVVGLPPGCRHELGALAFAVASRRAGLPVAYLGPDLPIDDWVTAADGAAAAVIGVVAPRDRSPALEVAHRLRAAHPGLVVALGGRSAPASTDLMRLPERLTDAVAAIEEVLASPMETPEPAARASPPETPEPAARASPPETPEPAARVSRRAKADRDST